jgi:sphingomyelin phosphodiesterase
LQQVYATLGNDSLPEAENTPNSIQNDGQTNAKSWNYNLLSSPWQENGWTDGATANCAATHYGAYAYTTSQGLKIISKILIFGTLTISTTFMYLPFLAF